MFFVVRSNDCFNFPLGLKKYIVIVKPRQGRKQTKKEREKKKEGGGGVMGFEPLGKGTVLVTKLFLQTATARQLLSHLDKSSRTVVHSPDSKKYATKTRCFHAFSHFGLHVWNSLPKDLRHCSNMKTSFLTILPPQLI